MVGQCQLFRSCPLGTQLLPIRLLGKLKQARSPLPSFSKVERGQQRTDGMALRPLCGARHLVDHQAPDARGAGGKRREEKTKREVPLASMKAAASDFAMEAYTEWARRLLAEGYRLKIVQVGWGVTYTIRKWCEDNSTPNGQPAPGRNIPSNKPRYRLSVAASSQKKADFDRKFACFFPRPSSSSVRLMPWVRPKRSVTLGDAGRLCVKTFSHRPQSQDFKDNGTATSNRQCIESRRLRLRHPEVRLNSAGKDSQSCPAGQSAG